MNILRLEIGEHWPDAPEATWALLERSGPRDTVLREGRGDLRQAPAADACEVILSGAQCALHLVRLPPGAKRDQAKMVAYALEERIAQETETQHFTVLGQRGDNTVVAVIARARLQRIVAACAELDRPVTAIWPALALLPVTDKEWLASADHAGGLLRTSDGAGYAWDAESDPHVIPWLLQQALTEARAKDQTPSRLRVLSATDTPTLTEWSQTLGIPVEAEPQIDKWLIPAERTQAANLLHGDFTSRRQHGPLLQRFKPALWITGTAIALHLIASVIHAGWLGMQARQLHTQQTAMFEQAFPGAAIVDPALQTRRLLNDLKSRQGQLRDDDFLALTNDLAESLGANGRGAVQNLQYENGSLKITLALKPPLDAKALTELLAARGISASQPNDGLGNSSGSTQLALRRSAP